MAKKQPSTKLKKMLQKEAPETLKKPKPGDFNNTAKYMTALARYLKKGHWSKPALKEDYKFVKPYKLK